MHRVKVTGARLPTLALVSVFALACHVRQLDRSSDASDASTDVGSSSDSSANSSSTGSTTESGVDPSADESDSGETDTGTGECGDGIVDPGERCDDGNTEPGDSCSADCRNPLVVCEPNRIFSCGDTLDNDNDGLVDLDDPECISPCDDSEEVFEFGLPGQNCVCCNDCMFDNNSGAGDDGCDYEPGCDPLLPDPECPARPADFCQQYEVPPECNQLCGPLTPNGCDCFGCCIIEGEARWIGIDASYADCSLGNLDACPPCTITPACFNACEPESCELCFLDPPQALAEGCGQPSCSDGAPCLDPYACPEGQFCQAGCCRGQGIP